jgi:hypothetical protein
MTRFPGHIVAGAAMIHQHGWHDVVIELYLTKLQQKLEKEQRYAHADFRHFVKYSEMCYSALKPLL